MHAILDALSWLFGTNARPDDWGAVQLAARALLVYFAALFLVRAGKNRFLGKNTAFDVVLGFMFGSMLSRAINGSPALFGTVAAAAVLIALHWVLSAVAWRSKRISGLLRGEPKILARDGSVDEKELKRSLVTEGDLEESLRLNGKIRSVSNAKEVVLERNGSISVQPRSRDEPRVIEVRVEAGVQTVRIELA